ncbi:hypothetical protein M885DRAFT_517913 [Pelagophyceae sp. CCMP2097]|nr:hypothetical protein M885DRAFT_517913 [Pelagophyceae sp. CCMP2097]
MEYEDEGDWRHARALPQPCSFDTTDDFVTQRTRKSSRQSYGGVTSPAPTGFSGGVSLGRIMAIAATSLAVVAMGAVSLHRAHAMMVPGLVVDAYRPRYAQLNTLRTGATTAPMTAASLKAAGTLAATPAAVPVNDGVDVVAYFSLAPGAAPVYGDAQFSHTVVTADALAPGDFRSTFWFATAENQALFAANPGAYAPQYGGFCSFGISLEMKTDLHAGMDVADASVGWMWSREYLGPPADPAAWMIREGKLYLTFLPEVMTVFADGYVALAPAADARWATWFGASGTALPNGPFNTACTASAYGPPVTRTCTWEPQLNGVALEQAHFSLATTTWAACRTALDAACGLLQGSNPVAANACSTCLMDNTAALLAAGCEGTTTALATVLDKAYCW